MGFFVQFPHPGGEHVPASAHMPWNVGAHKRKCLIAPGGYLDGDSVVDADLVFWGEWEPPSRVEVRWPARDSLPRALHRPYWTRPTTRGSRQNTDPWVWGDRMLYSNCRQTGARPARRPSSMQRLTRGSVICFGSTVGGEFCLDTVFVVASAEAWNPAGVAALEVDEAFKVCTAESMLAGEDRDDGDGCTVICQPDDEASFTLYRGASVDDPVDGMFSFVPARRADGDDPRFARPAIRLPGYVNPASTQSTLGSKIPLGTSTLRSLWNQVSDQVHAEDLLFAVHLRTPERHAGGQVPATDRRRC